MSAKNHKNISSLLESFGEDVEKSANDRIESRKVISDLIVMRTLCNLSQSDIAEELNCTQGKVSKLENGTDDNLKLREIAAYATRCNKIAVVKFSDKDATLMDGVKYHAFQITSLLNTICELSEGDGAMERAAVHSHIETLANLVGLVLQSASAIPCLESELCKLAESHKEQEDCGSNTLRLSVVHDDAVFT